MTGPKDQPDEDDLVPLVEGEAEGPDRIATLGEILEAHHLRFVAKVRKAQRKEGE
jgi:hypothetical protein